MILVEEQMPLHCPLFLTAITHSRYYRNKLKPWRSQYETGYFFDRLVLSCRLITRLGSGFSEGLCGIRCTDGDTEYRSSSFRKN